LVFSMCSSGSSSGIPPFVAKFTRTSSSRMSAEHSTCRVEYAASQRLLSLEAQLGHLRLLSLEAQLGHLRLLSLAAQLGFSRC
jgi:hypothetical protein